MARDKLEVAKNNVEWTKVKPKSTLLNKQGANNIIIECLYVCVNVFELEQRILGSRGHHPGRRDALPPQSLPSAESTLCSQKNKLENKKNDTETGTYNMICSTHRDL